MAAWLSVGVHLVAGLAMALVLRHGLETNDITLDRVTFLVEQQSTWIAGWLTWNLAAFTILYFVARFAKAHRGKGLSEVALISAVVVCAVAVPLDLTAEAIEMFVLPDLALHSLALDQQPRTLFFAWQRTATILTGFFANGLYTLSTVLLVWATRRIYPRWVVAAGALVGLAGFGLSAAALADSVAGMVATNVVLLPALLVWQIGVAVSRPSGQESREIPTKV
jgi:hypothetical protein